MEPDDPERIGRITTFTYEHVGWRPVVGRRGQGRARHDGAGPAAVADGLGRITTFTYDPSGRKEPCCRVSADDSADAGRAAGPAPGAIGECVTFTYDAAGMRWGTEGDATSEFRIAGAEGESLAPQACWERVTFTYGADGRMVSMEWPGQRQAPPEAGE